MSLIIVLCYGFVRAIGHSPCHQPEMRRTNRFGKKHAGLDLIRNSASTKQKKPTIKTRSFRQSALLTRAIRLTNGILTLFVALVLSSCGGSGASAVNPQTAISENTASATESTTSSEQGWVEGEFQAPENFRYLCENPRTGDDPATGSAYLDAVGTTTDENNWLRSWSNNLYLWYREIEDRNPSDYTTPEYFDLMKSFETTASGNPKDKYHFTYDTEEWRQLSQSGITAGYGAELAILSGSPPREIVVAFTEPNTPATAIDVNLARGARIVEVDGIDVESGTDTATLNAGLFPSTSGERHEFLIRDLGASEPRIVIMESALITQDPVQSVKVIATDSGDVGYMLFNAHLAPSELELIEAVETLAGANIVDLVLDLRYNGGGYLDIANELAFMIAGSAQAAGKVFSEVQFNDKHPSTNPVTGASLEPELFHASARGFSASQGAALPTLDLERLFVLTGPGTCSASESIINGLRGIDVDVVQIGASTCGKPYGFYAFDNCGTTYFSIQFRGSNAKGFGDYTDGFSPTNEPSSGTPLPGCFVLDDFDHALGDPLEGRLNTALAYRINGVCPTAAKASIVFKSVSTSHDHGDTNVRRPFVDTLGLLRQ